MCFTWRMSQEPEARETYHHGNLPDALVREGAKLLAEDGIGGFSLRQIAQRTGVTVGAPSHHFGNARGLLTAIATAGFVRLSKEMEQTAATARSSEDKVISMCKAYVEMGVTDPGYASVMFRPDLLNAEDERFRESAFHAFDLLKAALAMAAPDVAKSVQISTATKALWATMHGLTTLPMIEDQETTQIIRSTVRAHLAGMH